MKNRTDRKKGIKKYALAAAGMIAGCVLAVFLILLAVLTVTEYRPKEVEEVEVRGDYSKEPGVGEEISVLSWNIGYGALGDNADFFMDGGNQVMTADAGRVMENLRGIVEEIQEIKPDFVFMQEVDLDSKRSCHIDERQEIVSRLSGYQDSFAYNYKVSYVPYPLPPLGKVECGLYTLSSCRVASATRISLPCPFRYPVRLCNLKRALMVNRIPVKNSGKELVMVNLHLEAYDSGEGKAAQTAVLKEFLEQEAQAGNYVIAGGDFNQSFSSVDTSMYPVISDELWKPGVVETEDFSEGLQFLMDNRVPTCRSLDRPYQEADADGFQYYMLDGFILSDNVVVNSLETMDLQFEHSDHNPLLLRVVLQ